MPNNITNSVAIEGTADQIKAIFDFMCGPDWDDGTPNFFDFGKIKPMPEGMDVQCHSGVERCAKIAFGDDKEMAFVKSLGSIHKKDNFPGSFSDEDWGKYIQCLNNLRNHGHAYWYDWAIANWGTKWNAYSQNYDESSPETITFQTAWSGVPELIRLLSEKFRDVTVFYKYADEDTGSNVGQMVFNAGSKISDTSPESGSNAAYELAFELDPDEKQSYRMNSSGQYEYDEEAADAAWRAQSQDADLGESEAG